jgi:Flp pilus assembly protein TadB
MKRRLYFLLPDQSHALSVVNDLAMADIDLENIHAIAREGTLTESLPMATRGQMRDRGRRIESLLWNANLVVFGIALGALVVLAALDPGPWMLLPVAVMLATLIAGVLFTRVPNTHLDEFRDALAHGEVLLMVDVPLPRVSDVEYRIHRKHPEATVGGVGWTVDALKV